MPATSFNIKTTAHTIVDEELADSGGEKGTTTENIASPAVELILKIPPLTVLYWCEKMTATTFGETFADYFAQTLDFGYATTSIVLILLFVVTLACQLKVKTYWPVLFWAVMGTSSIAGTSISDFIDRTLGWGYPMGMGILFGILMCIIGCWKLSGEHMNVEGAMNRKAEVFYWSTILVSNTLGTAMGDYMADSLNLGFGAAAGIIGGCLICLAGLAYFSKVSHVLLFWVAFVLTRPFGATFGDLLTKSKSKGGLDLGTLQASMVILALFVVAFSIEMYNMHKSKKQKLMEKEEAATAVTEEKKIKAVVDTMGDHVEHNETEADFFP
jgi:uncharacterized membrane-anchored protein